MARRQATGSKRAPQGSVSDSLEALRGALRKFAADRDWDQFHFPKNLAIALSVEVAEPLVIQSCTFGYAGPTCRIRNIAQVPLGDISAWGYDKTGTRIDSSVDDTDLDGLAPGAVVRTQIVVPDYSKTATVVLCSVNPQSALGSHRFGIGVTPHF